MKLVRFFTAVAILSIVVVLSLIYQRVRENSDRPLGSSTSAGEIRDCGPLESLEDLRSEIQEAIIDHHLIFEGRKPGYIEYVGRFDNPATSSVRGLVIRARDCHGVKSPEELEVSPEFWNNIARPLTEIPRREKP